MNGCHECIISLQFWSRSGALHWEVWLCRLVMFSKPSVTIHVEQKLHNTNNYKLVCKLNRGSALFHKPNQHINVNWLALSCIVFETICSSSCPLICPPRQTASFNKAFMIDKPLVLVSQGFIRCPLFPIHVGQLSGWWFGTFLIFPYIGNVIIPTDYIIFFRGVGQPPTSFVFSKTRMI